MTYVLLVDDNHEHLAYLSALLRHHDLEHETVNHGLAALTRARESAPKLVLCDLQMPLMDGYTLLRHWKSDPALRNIPFVVHTSTYIDTADQELAVELGADEFILKFVDPDELMSRLKRILARSQPHEHLPPSPSTLTRASALEHYNGVLFRKLNAKTEELRAARQHLDIAANTQRDTAATHLSVLNGLPIQVAIIDNDGIIIQVNDAWRRHADGAAFPTLRHGVAQSYLEFLDSSNADNPDCGRIAAGIRSVLSGAASTFSAEHAWRSDAGYLWFETTVIPLQGVGSGGAVVMCTDISERKYIAAKIVESESQYQSMLNATAEGIYRVDTQGLCRFCNVTAARMLGYEDPNQVIGHSIHELHHHSHADGTFYPAADCRAYQAFRTAKSAHVDDEVFFRCDGSHFPVEYRSDPIWDGDRVTGAVITFMDITTRQNLQMQLLQSQKMEAVGRLAGGVAHDFNNALQIILTYSELLEERLPPDLVSFQHNQQILGAALRAASLTRQLLAFSRKQVLRPSLLNLTEVAKNMEEMIHRMIGEQINLQLDASPSVKPVSADRAQVEQLLMNLAINARDAMPLGGDILIAINNVHVDFLETQERKAVIPGMYVKLSVRDTGFGMNAATKARIFDPFFTTKEAGKGTGLGLSTVHGIVEQSGGYITVDSEPGCGAEFCVYFKAVEGVVDVVEPAKHGPQARQAMNGSGTILLVEDEDALRSIVGSTLRSNGYDVLEARDGITGIDLSRIHEHPIDLLLTDVILPFMSGRAIADELSITRPDTRVIYMSGYTDDIIAQHGLLNSNVVLLEKPFSRALLLETVRQALNVTAGSDNEPARQP